MAETDNLFKNDLGRLVDVSRPYVGKLTPAKAPAPIEEAVGFGKPEERVANTGASSGGTGVLSSPVTEQAFSTREYYPDEIVYTTDTMFAFVVRRIKTLTTKDADGNVIVINLADPNAIPAP